MPMNCLCIHDIPIFKGIPRESFVAFCDASQKITLSKGEYLFHQGDDANALYVVKSGTLKLTRLMESGEEIIIKLVYARHAIGENNLFSENPVHDVSAIALEETQLCSLNRSNYERVLLGNPALSREVIKSLGASLNNLRMQIAESATQSSTDRVLFVLRQLAEQNGIQTEAGTLINVVITQSELSSMVGLSRVMTSQILKKLETDGFISREKRKYVIL
jgi:CRP/FNR family transcriptional regulator